MNQEIRLQKFIADCGVASRRKSEELIIQGKVKVNGKQITELGTKVTAGKDIVTVDGKELKQCNKSVYVMLNKPEGYITTAKEQFNRPFIMDLLSDIKERIFPVGRLDMDTSGLIILTNDGDFAYKITHPKNKIDKTYIAEVKGFPDSGEMSKFAKGLKIEDYTTAPAKIRLVAKKKSSSIVEIIIHEGRNRQVKKMCEAIGHNVISLQRKALGGLEVGNLPLGKWKYLTKKEIEKIFE
ncbi:MAG: pseudouridine synthase [Deltaproteobacteria bacterium]